MPVIIKLSRLIVCALMTALPLVLQSSTRLHQDEKGALEWWHLDNVGVWIRRATATERRARLSFSIAAQRPRAHRLMHERIEREILNCTMRISPAT